MDIFVNNLLQSENEGVKTIERVLWRDRDYIVTIDVFGKRALPKIRPVKIINQQLEENEIEIIDDEPYFELYVMALDEKRLNDTYVAIQNNAWNLIKEAVKLEPDIYLKRKRGKIVQEIVNEYNVPAVSIYKYLKRYWQRGKTKVALLPDYFRSGAKGKERKSGDRKRGRPKKTPCPSGEGINIDDNIKNIFRVVINRYYHTRQKNSFKLAYELMVREFFSEKIILEDGSEKYRIFPAGKLPTLPQFRYWYKKEFNIKKHISLREGNHKYNLLNREITGKADENIFAPAMEFQIDSTPADYNIVSSFNRNDIIGRPCVYLVADNFSRIIVGLYIGLEHPSWACASMALLNAFTDKVSFCERYGISISEDEWPCYHLSDVVLADGELISKYADNLPETLNITVDVTPAGRPDYKSIIERKFGSVNTVLKRFTPGYIDKTEFRNYPEKAKLNLDEFYRMVITTILEHNKKWIEGYKVCDEMIADGINPVPIELWKWGIKNRSGRLRTLDERTIKLNLLPRAKAYVRKDGIRFKNLRYICNKAIEEQWFARARSKRGWEVKIAYDPRSMDSIFVQGLKNGSYEKCDLISGENGRGKTFDELEYYAEVLEYERKKYRQKELQTSIDTITIQKNIVKNAEKICKEDYDNNLSKTARVKAIKANRKNEIKRQAEIINIDRKNPQLTGECNDIDIEHKEKIYDEIAGFIEKKIKKDVKKNNEREQI
jgi:hypothetical protein